MQLDDKALVPIVAKAIMDGIDTGQRDLLIQKALEDMMAPRVEEGLYGKRTQKGSKLQEIFEDAVYVHVRKRVDEMLEADSNVKAQLDKFARDAITKALTDDDIGGKLKETLSDAVSRVFRGY